jgi:5,10-methylenetetrahydrofolate reductase
MRYSPFSTLATQLRARDGVVRLYGTTPPRLGSAPELHASAAEKLAARVRGLPLDGLIVYDLQDESGRTDVPRPFPFSATVDARGYAARLRALTGTAAVTYKCIGATTEPEWRRWLDEATAAGDLELLSIVGRPTSRGAPYPLSMRRAYELAAAHPARLTLGGVAIAERHGDATSESLRMIAKAELGCHFFVSQTVYHPDATIRMLTDYARDCRIRGVAPRRVVLTFAPCGRAKTMAFIKWLGVAIAPELERTILAAPSPLTQSIAICRANLRQILQRIGGLEVPLGINTESVSINKDEIDASIDLFWALGEVLREQSNQG